MTKEELVQQIKSAFEHVKLEDGIGLWEAQGIDDYADLATITALRNKDERNDWQKIPVQDLIACASSLSFFDGKGMRFCLPQFLLFDLDAKEIYRNQDNYSPDVIFTLGYNLHEEYQKNRFSLFNQPQIQAIIYYLDYKLIEYAAIKKQFVENDEPNADSIYVDYEYLELKRTMQEWEKKMDESSI
jgi:hypothetical protein